MSSYLIDRDSLSSSRQIHTHSHHTHAHHNHNWIDVNSNQLLTTSQQTYQRNDNDTRKMVADLQDQVRALKGDVEKKDALISELSSVKEIDKIRGIEAAKLDAIFSVERSSAENAKREVASLQVKYEAAATELSEARVKIQAREDRIVEYKRDIETIKSENAALNALVVSLRGKIKELEGDLGGYESAASKSGITISVLQKDNKEYQQKILELESRIRTHMTEREESERRTDVVHKKLDELALQISNITGTTIPGTTAGLDLMITKITEIVNENSMIKGKYMTTTEKLTQADAESKANRETINRLVNELNKLEKDSVGTKLLIDTLKAERDSALSTKTVLEKEIDTLKERMGNIQTAWQATKTELETKEGKYIGIEANLKQHEYDILYYKNSLNAFKEQVATLLSDGFVKVEANEDQIREKVKLLMTSSKDRGLMIASMEGKMQQLANQLTEQINLYKELENKYQKAEAKTIELEARFTNLDSEYCANQVLRDNLRSDKAKYLAFLERIGHILKINSISADVGLDMNVDVILARIEQLVRSENDSIQDKQTNIYNLQRKVKSLKEQLDNKDLHLDLLRKKLTSLEEEKCGRTSLEKEVDDHVMMSKKLKVKVDKLTQQLTELKNENTELKAQLMDMGCLRGRNAEQDKEIHRLIDRINELETEKNKQVHKITKLRDEVEDVNNEVSKTRSSADCAVQALSQELRMLKDDLERVKLREKQLLDFREVISRMLGLEISSLAVADYEIITRIERLIATVNGTILHTTTAVPVTTVTTVPTVTSLPAQYSTQYSTICSDRIHSSSSSLAGDTAYTSNRKYHHHHHHRERSPSPTRRHHHHVITSPSPHRSKSPKKVTIDPNTY